MLSAHDHPAQGIRLKWMLSEPFLTAIFVLSIAIFLIQGRSDGAYGDFAHVYGSASCVLSGSNPYSFDCVARALISHGSNPSRYVDPYWPTHPMNYPPITYYLVAPLALLNYSAAGLVWFWISAIALIAACVATIRLCPPTARTFVYLGVSVVLMTSGGLLRLGQLTTSALALLIIGSLLFLNRKHLVLAAILLALAACLKPQLILPSLAFFCLSRSTRKYALGALAGFALAFIAAGVALARQPGSAHWTSDWAANLRITPLGSSARIDTGIVNLEGLTSLITASPLIFRTIDLVVLAAIIAVLVIGFIRAREDWRRDWICIAAASFLTLLLVYHRSYDMRIQILSLPALGLLWKTSTRMAGILTVLGSLLLFSTAVILVKSSIAHFGISITHNLMFRLLVERQQAVITLLATIVWAVTIATFKWTQGTATDGRTAA